MYQTTKKNLLKNLFTKTFLSKTNQGNAIGTVLMKVKPSGTFFPPLPEGHLGTMQDIFGSEKNKNSFLFYFFI